VIELSGCDVKQDLTVSLIAVCALSSWTSSRSGEKVAFVRHEYVEVLLGVYARQLNTVLMEISYLLQRIQSKQEFLALAMSAFRNRMIWMNLSVSVIGLSFGAATTVAGFFGMNLLTGLETSPYAFLYVVCGCSILSTTIALSAFNSLSGQRMQKHARKRMAEIETLTVALSDICALDYTFKTVVESGQPVDKALFRKTLRKARRSTVVSDAEVDLLFDVFDHVKDGSITGDDFRSLSLGSGFDSSFADHDHKSWRK
jgi:hypothetical protein